MLRAEIIKIYKNLSPNVKLKFRKMEFKHGWKSRERAKKKLQQIHKFQEAHAYYLQMIHRCTSRAEIAGAK